jgi:hypothetical protein
MSGVMVVYLNCTAEGAAEGVASGEREDKAERHKHERLIVFSGSSNRGGDASAPRLECSERESDPE